MKTFKKFNKDRVDKFIWHSDDLEHHLKEYTHDAPLKLSQNISNLGGTHPTKGTPEHDSFQNHHDSLSEITKKHISKYKGGSSRFNYFLRHQKTTYEKDLGGNPNKTFGGFYGADDHEYNKEIIRDHKEHDKHMMEATNHRIEHHHTTYRVGFPGDEKHFPTGHKFTDHGYTGTSFHMGIAEKFRKHGMKTTKGKQIIHVIHVTPGTKGHYLDVDGKGALADEHELLLQRGTKFKVTHHSEDDNNHYIHSKVVSQHQRKLPE